MVQGKMKLEKAVAAILILLQVGIMRPIAAFGQEAAAQGGGQAIAASASAMISAAEGGVVRLGGAEVEIPPGALAGDTEIRITRLCEVEDTGEGIKNATAGGGGYRFEPAGTKFAIPATVRIGHRGGLAESAKETLFTYYYNKESMQWEPLERSSVEGGQVVSLTDHFTDMINGVLSPPEAAGPVGVNLNSIKGLEAAAADAGVGALEGLEGGSDGSASFRLAVAAPGGRAGMAPAVYITYSSGGGVGISGKGFDVQYGGRIEVDARYGAARYGERQGGADRYAKDGVLLELIEGGGEDKEYRLLRRVSHSLIKHYKDGDYWEITEVDGRKKTYGKSEGSWCGAGEENKNIWNLEREEDAYGNTVTYHYEREEDGAGWSCAYPQEIRYTGKGDDEGAHRIGFEYEARPDARFDGRGGYMQTMRKRVTGITVEGPGGQAIRSYNFEYMESKDLQAAKESLVSALVCRDENGGEAWRYGFEYERLPEDKNGRLQIFGEPKFWGNMALSAMRSAQSGTQASMGGGVGVGPAGGIVDVRASGGGNVSSGGGESHSEHTLADINGDGVPDMVWQDGDKLHARLNTPNGLSNEIHEITLGALAGAALENEKSGNFSYGGNVYAGVGKQKGGGVGIGVTKTAQRGSSRLTCSLQDIDGDGLVDIAVSGRDYYYKNVSGGGEIKFEIRPISAAASDYEEEVTESEREEYSGEYYQQRPFRMWKAPYGGMVSIEQKVKKLEGGGAVTARVYGDNGALAGGAMRVESGEASKTAGGIEVTERSRLYFVHEVEGESWDDIRGNDFEWGVKPRYAQVRPWRGSGDLVRYVIPEEIPAAAAAKVAAVIKSMLYDEFYVPDPFNAGRDILEKYAMKKGWRGIANGEGGEELRQALHDGGYYIPLIMQAADFESFMEGLNDFSGLSGLFLLSALTAAAEAARCAASFYVYDASIGAYRERERGNETALVETENKLRVAMGNKAAYLGGMKVNGVTPEGVGGKAQYRQEAAGALEGARGAGSEGSVLNGGKTLCLGTHNGNAAYIEKDESGAWRYNDGQPRGCRVETAGASFVKVYLGGEGGGAYEAEAIWEFSEAEAWPSHISGEEMEALAADRAIELPGFPRAHYEPGYWEGRELPALENWLNGRAAGAITEEGALALLDCYEIEEIEETVPNEPPLTGTVKVKKEAYKLKSGKASEAEIYLKGAEREEFLIFMGQYYGGDGAGGYILQNGGNSGLDAYFKEAAEKHSLIKYQKAKKELRYNSEYAYAVSGPPGGETYVYTSFNGLALEGAESGMKLSWDSGKDFSTGNYAAEKQFEVLDKAVEINSDDILYGGYRGWHYGVWMGGERDNPFSRNKLYGMSAEAERLRDENIENPKDYEAAQEEAEAAGPPEKLERDEAMGGAYERDYSWKSFYLVRKGSEAHSELGAGANGSALGEDRAPGLAPAKLLNSGAVLVGSVDIGVEQAYEWKGGERTVKDIAVYYFPYIEGDRVHTNRAGGASYYKIPGILSGGGPGGGVMPSLRSSSSEGSDLAFTLGFLSVSANYGFNDGSSWMEQNLMDVNGDGIPDIVQSSGKGGGKVKVWYGKRQGGGVYYTDYEELDNAGALSRHETRTDTYGAGAGAGGSVAVEKTSSGAYRASITKSGGGSASASVSRAEGRSWQEAGMMDINGDGIPDYIINGQARLGTGSGYAEGFFGGAPGMINEGKNESRSVGASVGIAKSYPPWSDTDRVNAGISVGVSTNWSHSFNEAMMIDINGDGLPDYVTKVSNTTDYIEVSFNTGSGFLEPVMVCMPGWGDLTGVGSADGTAGPLERSVEAVRQMPVAGPQSYVPKPPSYNTDSDSYKGFNYNYLDYSSTSGTGVNGGVNLGGTASFTVPTYVPFAINVSLNGSAGVSGSDSSTGVTVRMMDVNGDGLPDHVMRVPGYGAFVKLNLSGRAGLLRKIKLPQGGEYRLDYEPVGNTTEMPHLRHALSKVERDSKDSGGGGIHVYVTSYKYKGGHYDRILKEFFGFGEVVTTRGDGSVETVKYHNDQYYSKGFEMGRSLRDRRGRLLLESSQAVDNSPYARPVASAERRYGGKGLYIQTGREWSYDGYGNVIYYAETVEGNNKEGVQAIVEYEKFDAPHIYNRPKWIRVSGRDGVTLRYREGSYDERGSLTQLRQYSGAGECLKHNYTYNEYGLMGTSEDPAGVVLEYGYDGEVSQYLTRVSQRSAQGGPAYEGLIEWDVTRGLKTKETDASGNSVRYEYDAQGRLKKVYTDYDGETAAVTYGYHTGAGRWHAVTENKVSHSAGDGGVMLTVAELDGLGRVRRTAKSGETHAGGRGWNVSGAAEYDGKGRAVKTGQTYFVSALPGKAGVAGLLSSGVEMKNPTLTEYDALDRATKTTLPDGSVMGARYGAGPLRGELCHIVEQTDPLGNVSVKYSDARGNTKRVERRDGKGHLLTSAEYEYNAIGEMLTALDAAGNPLIVKYDMLGRKTAMESADMGRNEYKYNAKGQLEIETTGELRKQGRQIRYEYDGFGRIARVVYPVTADAVYEYGPPNAAGGAAGKLVKLTDNSGAAEYWYGKLGEVIKEKRTLNVEGGWLTKTEEAEFEYFSDYLGRMEKIKYPDGEEVSYGYGYGGEVKSVIGAKRGVEFKYVEDAGYDERGRRVYIKLGNGVETEYKYHETRDWLSSVKSVKGSTVLQNITYDFDSVGNVKKYENNSGAYYTEQKYAYDDLYQLIGVSGESRNYRFGVLDYTARYSQSFAFDAQGLGNMTNKSSSTANSGGRTVGDPLDYQLDYEYEKGTRKAVRIGKRHYSYDLSGNLVAEQDGPFAQAPAAVSPEVFQTEDGAYYAEGAWGLIEPGSAGSGPGKNVYRRDYKWDERNRLAQSSDTRFNVRYKYTESGERASKYATSTTGGGGNETLYFGKLWSRRYQLLGDRLGHYSKHIFLGEARLASKVQSGDGAFVPNAEAAMTYYYHSDHLGSAQLITDCKGEEYERLEYTPYGELWIDKTSALSILDIPYRFTGKERDSETNLYYFGARYLDAKTARWLSTDPAMGEYVPDAPVSDAARKRNGNLPGMGGVFNAVNLHAYHYSNNNPVKYTDPDGRTPIDEVNTSFSYSIGQIGTQYGVNVQIGDDVNVEVNTSTSVGQIGVQSGVNVNVGDEVNVNVNLSSSIGPLASKIELNVNTEAGNENVDYNVQLENPLFSVEFGLSANFDPLRDTIPTVGMPSPLPGDILPPKQTGFMKALNIIARIAEILNVHFNIRN